MNTPGSVEVMQLLVGLFWLVVLVGIIIGLSSTIWAWQHGRTGGFTFEAKQLHFAAVTLTGIGLLFALSMAMYFFGGESSPGKNIFEACKTILPPIITLILGFYFGRETRGDGASGKPGAAPGQGAGP